MKWYIVVEGVQTERLIYRAWLEHVFPDIKRAPRVEDMAEARYFLLVGHGYPSYLRRIRKAVEDIREEPGRFDRLWVCVDAEERTADERRAEITDIITEAACPVESTVVVHDCCIETWLLGNRKLVKRNPQSERLRGFYAHHDVLRDDPERMPALLPDYPLRAKLHLQYLQGLFRERNMSYTKNRPGDACENPYLRELVDRVDQTDHLSSLRFLVQHWRELGASI